MKTKKALAVLLAVVMLVMPLAVSSFAASGVVSGPLKTVYTDYEYFNPIGISVVTSTGNIVEYTPGDSNFRFDPALNELLTVNTNDAGEVIPTTVAVYYNNEYVDSVEIIVSHCLGELTAVDSGHGKFCLGCGTLHEFEKHTITNWIPNDDGGIFVMQTKTGKCDICGAEVTESIPGSERFNSLFDGNNLTETESTILDYVRSILVTLIQMLVGIK